jgi:hypothetical protein
MKLVTNLDRRRRWDDPLTGTSIPPKKSCPVEVEDDIANGTYFKRAVVKRKLTIQDKPKQTAKPIVKKSSDAKASKGRED